MIPQTEQSINYWFNTFSLIEISHYELMQDNMSYIFVDILYVELFVMKT